MRWAVTLLGALLLAAAGAHAADEELPGRVGRIASVQPPLYHSLEESAGEWSQIGLNYPVAQGDNLWVDRDGHAEVDYGAGQFRLAADTNLHVSRLDERQLALFIASGRVIVRVRVLEPEDSVRVDTPTTQVSLMRPGLYRIDVVPGIEQTTLIVREGEAEVATAAGPQRVLPGQTAALTGTAEIVADIFSGGGIDGFDAWSAARDRVYERPRQNAYVSRQMVGQADLDAYGDWQTYPDYGPVWFPTVDAEWAPYRFGHWTWLPGWGYTWVDDARWGYAPFHYGRWVFVASRWGWCPGAFVARPLWAPALVAWYGGSGWSYSMSVGGPVYGWVPLGWRESFVPWWRGCSSQCWARYNRPYAVDTAARRVPPTHFANWRVPGGVTAISGVALTGGKPVAANRVAIGSDIAFAPSLVAAPPAVKPAPSRPGAVRPGPGVPQPASAAFAERAPAAPAMPAGRVATQPLPSERGPRVTSGASAERSPTRIGESPGAGTVVRPAPVQRDRAATSPATSVDRAGTGALPLPVAQPEREARSAPSPTSASAPPPAHAVPPTSRAVPAPAPQVIAPAPRVVAAPAPAPQGLVPAPRVVPAPAAASQAVVPAPRVVPAPAAVPLGLAPVPRVVPAPAPPPQGAGTPAPAPAERSPARLAPPNPGGRD